MANLIADLWNFIDNTSEDDPARQEKFFELRERVRQETTDDAPVSVSEEIAKLIDVSSLLHVLTAIELVCADKAELMRHHLQERHQAALWDAASKAVGVASRHKSVERVS